MRKIEKFEDLIAWRKARDLTKQIYEVTQRGDFAKDFGLKDQIRRASVSIMSNIAEGFERGGRAEFHQFLPPRLHVLRFAPNCMSLSMQNMYRHLHSTNCNLWLKR